MTSGAGFFLSCVCRAASSEEAERCSGSCSRSICPPTGFTDHHCQFYSQKLSHLTVPPCVNLEQYVSTVIPRRAGCSGSTKQGSFEAGVLNVANFNFFGLDRKFKTTHTPVSLNRRFLYMHRAYKGFVNSPNLKERKGVLSCYKARIYLSLVSQL